MRRSALGSVLACALACGGGPSSGGAPADASANAARSDAARETDAESRTDGVADAAGDAAVEVGARLDGGDAAADVRGGGTSDASDGSLGGAASDVVLSDQCTSGIISIASDVLNPGDVYLNGTLKDGACYVDALTHWSDPNSACTGFDCYFDPLTAVIRPTDGRMLYMNTFEYLIREFHAESCPMARGGAYPSAPLANDTIIPTPMCPDATGGALAGVAMPDAGITGVAGFVVSPEGDVYYHCFKVGGEGAVWYDLAGNAVYDESNGYPLYKIARGRMALVRSQALQNFKLANLTTGVLTDIGAPPPWTHDAGAFSPPTGFIMAIRALDPAGFWVAVGFTSSDPELWEIHPDGTSTKIGSYPPVPTGQGVYSSTGQAALDGCGALLQVSIDLRASQNTIVRRQVQGSSLVVYDEATMPLVRIFGSYLVTGP
jgi:hypothetical protein